MSVYSEPWYKDEVAKAERGNREHVARYERSFTGIMAKANTDGGDDDAGKRVDHHASTVANLLVEAGSFPHRAAALQHLLHKPSGQALLSRMSKRDPPMDTILSIMKAGGIAGTCAAIVAKAAPL